MRRVLCLGLDGADYDLVRDLLAQERLPTLAGLAARGAFGPLRSTVPAVTPTAWSSFLTGLNPAGHGIFNFSTNPNRSPQRVESAASRAGIPLWRRLDSLGIRSAFVGIPFTYPAETIDGIVVTGYGGPERPQITPPQAAERIRAAYPGYVTAHHPMGERWWEDFDAYARRLVEHVDETAGICRTVLELEPDLQLLCVDFMSSDHAGHLGYNRLDPGHPAHDPGRAGDELIQVYEAIDRACGELIDEASRRFGEEVTALVLSDHGMKPIYWTFHANRWLEETGHLRYRRRSLQPLKGGSLTALSKVDQRLARTTRGYARALDLVPGLPRPRSDRAFADIDFGSTRAYCFATGGQIFLGEASGARRDPRYRGAARRRTVGGAPSGHRRAGVRRLSQGGALPRALPRQGARNSHPPARRADPRRLVATAMDGRLRASRQARSGALLRVLRTPRPDRDTRRGGRGDPARQTCLQAARSRSFRPRSSACSERPRTVSTGARSRQS